MRAQIDCLTSVRSRRRLCDREPPRLKRRRQVDRCVRSRARRTRPCLRLVAVDLLGHFAGSADARTAMESLLKDTDWRVRQEAETVLEHEGVLPGGYSVPLTDLLARWLRRFFWLCKTVNGLGRLVIRAPDFDRMRGTSPQWSQFPAPGAAVPSRFRPSFPYSTNK